MDREATRAFMSSNPPSFDGSDSKKLQGWMHKVKIRFITCHIEEHLQVNFASALLDGQAFDWWIQQQGIEAHDSWTRMCMALRQQYDTEL